jgi:catecholate siderophore receptor
MSSSTIRSRKHSVNRYALVMAASALALPVAALADADADQDHKGTEVTIKGERHLPYKTDKASSPKKTEALVDTPQTLSIISKELLEDQNATTLVDALRNTPGITMQLGENGNTAAGDTFQLRGFSATSSIYLDGIRDLGAVSRDVFTIEQIEIAKGPAGSDVGRGASGGYINLVSKLPSLRAGSSATASLYSEGGERATADVNMPIGETSAFRLNVMAQDIDVPGRNEVKNSGWGIAPSYALGLGTNTRFYVFGQVVHQDNVPDGGVPVIGLKGYNAHFTLPTSNPLITQAQLDLNTAALNAAPAVDRTNYYGSVHDYEKVDASMLTSKIEHNFRNGWNLTNTTRYGQTKMDRVLTGINAINALSAAFDPADPTTWTVSQSRQRVDQDNKIFANATNLSGSFQTGDWQHDLSTGVEIAYESQVSVSYSTTPPGGTAPTVTANLYNPVSDIVLPGLYATGATSDGESTTVSGYVFDTAKLGKWLLSAGLRVDNYTIKTNNTPITGAVAIEPIHDSGTLASWNLGAVYKPRDNGSVYISLVNAMTPPGSSNFQLSSTASSLANAAFDPVETENLEIGTKWDFFNNHLSVTAAYYSTTAKNELALEDPTNLGTYIQLGERKVSGIELGLIGQVNPKWLISAGLQTLDTEITQGTTGNNSNGAATRFSPDLTATVWTTYKVTPKFTIGGGLAYTSEQLLVVNPATVIGTQNGLPEIPAATVFNAMAAYDINPRLALQLNVYNVTDEDYISSLNSGGSRVVFGQPQSATLSLKVRF